MNQRPPSRKHLLSRFIVQNYTQYLAAVTSEYDSGNLSVCSYSIGDFITLVKLLYTHVLSCFRTNIISIFLMNVMWITLWRKVGWLRFENTESKGTMKLKKKKNWILRQISLVDRATLCYYCTGSTTPHSVSPWVGS